MFFFIPRTFLSLKLEDGFSGFIALSIGGSGEYGSLTSGRNLSFRHSTWTPDAPCRESGTRPKF